MKIKKNDLVVVISGEEKGATPRRVTQVLDGGNQVVVESVNLVYKHVRRGHPKSPQGGRLRLEMPMSAGKVMYYCDHCERGVRLGLRYTADGAKERYCKKCGKTVGQVSPARAGHATK
jgi:large subunit ribosomal protein L24